MIVCANEDCAARFEIVQQKYCAACLNEMAEARGALREREECAKIADAKAAKARAWRMDAPAHRSAEAEMSAEEVARTIRERSIH